MQILFLYIQIDANQTSRRLSRRDVARLHVEWPGTWILLLRAERERAQLMPRDGQTEERARHDTNPPLSCCAARPSCATVGRAAPDSLDLAVAVARESERRSPPQRCENLCSGRRPNQNQFVVSQQFAVLRRCEPIKSSAGPVASPFSAQLKAARVPIAAAAASSTSRGHVLVVQVSRRRS